MQPPSSHPRSDIAVRDALLTRVESLEQERCRLDAEYLQVLGQLMRAVTSAHGQAAELEYRSLRLEVATSTRQREHTAGKLLDTAWTVTEHYPRVHQTLREAGISLAHVRVIADAGRILTTGSTEGESQRAAYEEEVLPFAAEESPARLRPIAQRIAAAHAQQTLTEQHAEALTRRRVWVQDADQGMADLIAHLPAEEAYAIRDRLTRIAADAAAADGSANAESERTASAPEGDAPPAPHRSRDEIRADALCDLLLERPGATQAIAGRIQAQVQLVVPGEVVGLPGTGGVAELIGHGPIAPDTAASIAGTASVWERVAVTPSGEVLAVDRYRPTPQMRRLLAARDVHCRAPGCRVPARRCDLDHTVDAAAGGPTRTDNLAHLCRGHHTVKHHTGWTVTQETGGVMRWRSPTGRETVDKPPSRVRFSPMGSEEQAD